MENKRFSSLALFSTLILIVLFITSLLIGSVDIDLRNILIKGSREEIIFFFLRLPRAIAALLAGLAFSISGCLIQSATSNSLASPNIIGINAGSGFAVLFFLSFFPSLFCILPIAAFIGAILAVSLVFLISSCVSRISSSSSLILSGVAVNALFNALISIISSIEPDIMSSYSAFSIGGFANIEASSLYIPAILIIASSLLAFFLSPIIDLIKLGDEITASMGYKPKKVRIILILLASLASASAVTFSGLLGFVGLVTPHIASFLSGGSGKKTLILSSTIGPSIVILSDILARTVIRPSELPAGAFMAILGVPFFIFLLISKKGEA